MPDEKWDQFESIVANELTDICANKTVVQVIHNVKSSGKVKEMRRKPHGHERAPGMRRVVVVTFVSHFGGAKGSAHLAPQFPELVAQRGVGRSVKNRVHHARCLGEHGREDVPVSINKHTNTSKSALWNVFTFIVFRPEMHLMRTTLFEFSVELRQQLKIRDPS